MLDGLSETVSAARVDGRSRTRAALEAWGTDRQELEQGVTIDDFDLRNVPQRLAAVGDLWSPLLASRGRFDLAALL